MPRKSSKSPSARRELDANGIEPARHRVAMACNRCRLKKSKCTGKAPCDNCQSNQAVCSYSRSSSLRCESYSQKHVHYLMSQHERMVTAVQDMYKRLLAVESWEGPPLEETSTGTFSVNDILVRLGHIDNDGPFSDPCSPDDESVRSELGTNDLETMMLYRDSTGGLVEPQKTSPMKGASPQENWSYRLSSTSTPSISIASSDRFSLDEAWEWLPQQYLQSSGTSWLDWQWSECLMSSGILSNEQATCLTNGTYYGYKDHCAPLSQ